MKKILLSIFAVLFAFAGVQAQSYVKVTSAPADWSGDYLIVYEDGNVAFDGSLTNLDSTPNTINVSISNGEILATENVNKSKFTIAKSGTAYTIQSASGYYIGRTATSNGLNSNNSTEYTNTISFSSNNVVITSSGGPILQYNSDSNQLKFRYFKSTQKPIALYKYTTDGGGGGETPETPVAPAAPTLPAACNFDDAMTVEITGIAEGATAYYSLNDENNWIEGSSVEITETTTVYAKVVKDELSSGVVSETYTKNTPVTPPAEGEVVDVLNRELTGISGTSYSSWSGKTVTSDAVYAGQSAGGNDAIQLRSNNSNSGIVTTKSGGKAKKVAVVWQSSTSGGRTLNVYGKNTAYSVATDLYSTSTQGTLLGTIVCGTSTELVIEGDYEYIGVRSASGAMYLTSISITWDESAGVTPVAPNAPVLPESTTFKGSMLVEITSIAADATVYYTTDESDPATSATRVEYTEPFEITATTTVKAVAVNEVGTSEMATATYTLFVVEETTGYYVKVVSAPADWSGKYLIVYEEGTDAYVFNGKDEANGYVSAVTDGDVIKANSEIDAVAVTIATMEGGYSISTVSGYMYKTAYSNGVDFGETAKAANTFEIAEDGVVITSGNNDDKTTFSYNKAVDQMRFRYYKSGQQPVQLYKYVEELPTSHTLTVSEAGYATLYLGFNARIPSVVEAYTVTTVNDGWVSLTQVTGALPANTGVIIKASAGEYKFFDEATATADVTGNLLEGTAAATEIDVEAYVLGNVDGVGLYKAKMTDGKWLNNANKAYLPASVANGAASYSFRFGEGTTGVENVVVENEVKAIYDLTGRRVENISAPGIYIVGGKKVLVR